MNKDLLEKKFIAEFSSLLPERMETESILKNLPTTKLSDKTFLDIGLPNPIMSHHLRQKGGVWSTIARSPLDAAAASQMLGCDVCCLNENGVIPFKDASFDYVIVALGMLPAMNDQELFLRECHRVLKPNGKLIISIQNKKKFNIINLLRKSAAKITEGYAPIMMSLSYSDIFEMLKTGFNVISQSSFSKFFVELTRIAEYKEYLKGFSLENILQKYAIKYSFAQQLDLVFFAVRGNVTTVTASKRQWRERTIPVLNDGRTIQEACLFTTD